MSILDKIQVQPSPNHNERIGGAADMLLLHYTGMETGEGALERLCDPAAQVSAHYLVFEDGRIISMVDEERRAWHAGVASWAGEAIDGPVLSLGDRGDQVAELQFQLADYGYGIAVDGWFGVVTADIVTAFQRHFRPVQVDGAADLSTVGTLRLLRDAR